jgi:hypothetical protein
MDEHAGALRLMALTLCRPINTCFVPSPAQKLAAASAKVDDLLDTYRRLCGYLRPEANFPSLEALMAAIHGDIDGTRARLAGGEADSAALSAHPFLRA